LQSHRFNLLYLGVPFSFGNANLFVSLPNVGVLQKGDIGPQSLKGFQSPICWSSTEIFQQAIGQTLSSFNLLYVGVLPKSFLKTVLALGFNLLYVGVLRLLYS